MTKLHLIFGAGASNGSASSLSISQNHNAQPPLTSGLFNHAFTDGILKLETSVLLSRIEEIRRKLRSGMTVEDLLGFYKGLANEGNSQVAALLDDLIWYLGRLLSQCSVDFVQGGSYYDSLINRLNDKRVNFFSSTFNYDSLLEQAIGRIFSHRYESMEDYVVKEMPVVKLHGSWNWFDDGDSSIKVYNQNILQPAKDQKSRLKLVLGLPIPQGKKFLCPNHHLAVLKASLTAPISIMSIGWSGSEPHYFDLLKKQNIKVEQLFVVGNSKSGCEKVVEEFKKVCVPKHVQTFHGGFGQFVEDELEKLV